MRIAIRHGRLDLEADLTGRCLGAFTGPPPLEDATAAARAALEAPAGYPPLRRALTPGDSVAVLLGDALPDAAGLLVAVLDHVATAGVEASAVTIVCPDSSDQDWVDDLPERHEDVTVEVHDAGDRRRLSYLATTAAGRRLYLNRAAVDADQLVVLSERRFDLHLGYSGAEATIFPALGDADAKRHALAEVNFDVPGEEPWPPRREAMEVSWLLGQPYHVQAIGSRGGDVSAVVAGAEQACREGVRLLERGWKVRLPRRADLAVLTFTADPSRLTFADLAGAAFTASRVMAPGGRVVLIADASPAVGAGGEVLARADDAALAASALRVAKLPASAAALMWASAAAQVRLSLLGAYPGERAEELFATAVRAEDLSRMVASAGDVVAMEDAQRMMAVVE